MKKHIAGFIAGVVVAVLCMGFVTSALAANGEVVFSPYNILFKGEKLAEIGDEYTLADGTKVPFSLSYGGTTYLPARKLSELLGIGIAYDNATKSVMIGDAEVPALPPEEPKRDVTSTSLDPKDWEWVFFDGRYIFERYKYASNIKWIALNGIYAYKYDGEYYLSFAAAHIPYLIKSNQYEKIASQIVLRDRVDFSAVINDDSDFSVTIDSSITPEMVDEHGNVYEDSIYDISVSHKGKSLSAGVLTETEHKEIETGGHLFTIDGVRFVYPPRRAEDEYYSAKDGKEVNDSAVYNSAVTGWAGIYPRGIPVVDFRLYVNFNDFCEYFDIDVSLSVEEINGYDYLSIY